MTNLAIVAFEGRHTADEALLRLMKMEADWEANLYEVAVVTRDKDGQVHLRSSDGMTADGMFGGAAIGSMWGLLIGAMLFSRKYPKMPFFWVADRVAIAAILGGAFIRLGNFFNSEIIQSDSLISNCKFSLINVVNVYQIFSN